MTRPGMKLTDRERLQRLLQYADLTSVQRGIFQRWYDDISSGKSAELAPRDRLWVEVLYEQHHVGDRRAAARKRVRETEQAKTVAVFSPGALPKKPPGR